MIEWWSEDLGKYQPPNDKNCKIIKDNHHQKSKSDTEDPASENLILLSLHWVTQDKVKICPQSNTVDSSWEMV